MAIGPAAGSCGTAAYTKQTVIVRDIQSDPLWADYRQLAKEHGLAACWSSPIFDSQQRVVGTFAVYYRDPRSPSADHMRVVEMATHTAAIAIERALAGQRIEHLAYYDALTELPNRSLFHDRVSQVLTRAERDGKEMAILFIDLDRFKTINDSLGHDIGDRLLAGSREAYEQLPPRGRYHFQAGRRRVRGSAAGDRRAGRRARGPEHPRARSRPVRHRRQSAQHHLQHRHQPLSPRRRRRRDAHQERRYGDVPRQGQRRGHLSILHPRDEPRRVRAAHGRERPAPCARYRPVRAVLPAADRDQDRADDRRRGADSLAASSAGHPAGGPVHRSRRGDRVDRGDRRVGPARGLPAEPRMAAPGTARDSGRGQPVGPATAQAHCADGGAGSGHTRAWKRTGWISN